MAQSRTKCEQLKQWSSVQFQHIIHDTEADLTYWQTVDSVKPPDQRRQMKCPVKTHQHRAALKKSRSKVTRVSQDGSEHTPKHNKTRFLLIWKCIIQNKTQFNKTSKHNTSQDNHNTMKKGRAESCDQSSRMGGPVNHRSRSKSE